MGRIDTGGWSVGRRLHKQLLDVSNGLGLRELGPPGNVPSVCQQGSLGASPSRGSPPRPPKPVAPVPALWFHASPQHHEFQVSSQYKSSLLGQTLASVGLGLTPRSPPPPDGLRAPPSIRRGHWVPVRQQLGPVLYPPLKCKSPQIQIRTSLFLNKFIHKK